MEVQMHKSIIMILALIALLSFLSALPRELVVVEIGTGTWCGYCPGAAMGAHDLLANGHPVAIVENHNGDNYANTYSNARNTYYNITGFPTAFFDGLNPTVGGSSSQSMYSSYLPKVNARMAIPSHYTLAAEGTNTGLQYNINVTVAKPEDDTNTNVVLHAVITETDIPQVWGNQTEVDDVNRLMVPSQSGTPVTLATGGSTVVPLSFAVQSSWNMAKLELVVFLQNVTTKEILQGKKYSLPGLTGASPSSATSFNFPDLAVGATANLPLTLTNFFDATATGTLTSSNPAFTVTPNTYSITGGHNQSFTVTFNPTAPGTFTGNLTIAGNLQNYPNIVIPMSGNSFANAAPVVTDVMVSGPPVVYQNLTSSYTFTDPDGNTEGASSIQWYRVVNNTPQAITNAILATYKTAVEDIGFPLCFSITPRDQHGAAGTLVMSAQTLPIEVLPPPQNFVAAETEDNVVSCSWQRPHYFEGKGFVGYRVYRNGLLVNTITNPAVMSFVDTYVPDGTYEYWAVALFNDPMMISDPSNVVTVVIGGSDNSDVTNPNLYTVSVSPNPFKTNATIAIKAGNNEAVRLDIYNIKGQMVRSYRPVTDQNGDISIAWNGTDNSGSIVESGIYFYKMSSGKHTSTGRIILVK